MEDEYLATEGVYSTVWDRTNGRVGGLGHVALFDWDGHADLGSLETFYDDGLSGPTFVFESSEGKLHGWNVRVRRFPATAKALADYRDDTKHKRVGEQRGWWRLRVGEKRAIGDQVYKKAPEYVGYYDDNSGGRVSDPHLELARVCGVRESVVKAIRERYDAVGDGTKIVSYATMTDVEKLVRRRME
jgi:hypothetical protein